MEEEKDILLVTGTPGAGGRKKSSKVRLASYKFLSVCEEGRGGSGSPIPGQSHQEFQESIHRVDEFKAGMHKSRRTKLFRMRVWAVIDVSIRIIGLPMGTAVSLSCLSAMKRAVQAESLCSKRGCREVASRCQIPESELASNWSDMEAF